LVIRTENAAKPPAQRSKYVSGLIRKLEPVEQSFDIGCGKLRYLNDIMKVSQQVTLVDSEIQISRQQVLFGKCTSMRDLFLRSNSAEVMSVREFGIIARQFDRGFCLNVLPLIPLRKARRSLLDLVFGRLRPGAECLISVQYRNSDFTRMSKLPNARPHLDGYLIDSLRGLSFYGLIPPSKLRSLVTSAGFEVVDQVLNDGSVYLRAKRPRSCLAKFRALIDEGSNFRLSQAQVR
jgi:hypothetical protein